MKLRFNRIAKLFEAYDEESGVTVASVNGDHAIAVLEGFLIRYRLYCAAHRIPLRPHDDSADMRRYVRGLVRSTAPATVPDPE